MFYHRNDPCKCRETELEAEIVHDALKGSRDAKRVDESKLGPFFIWQKRGSTRVGRDREQGPPSN